MNIGEFFKNVFGIDTSQEIQIPQQNQLQSVANQPQYEVQQPQYEVQQPQNDTHQLQQEHQTQQISSSDEQLNKIAELQAEILRLKQDNLLLLNRTSVETPPTVEELIFSLSGGNINARNSDT